MRELDDTGRARLAQGAAVTLRCLSFEPPRAGARWWGALGVPSVRVRPPVIVHDRMLRTLMLDRRANALVGRRGDRYALRIERSARVADRSADRQEVEHARTVVQTCEGEMRRIHGEVAARTRRIRRSERNTRRLYYAARSCGRHGFDLQLPPRIEELAADHRQ